MSKNRNRSRLPAAQAHPIPITARVLMLGGGAIHIAYGLGSLLAPEQMVTRGYAPDTHELPDPRLLLRAFGGHLLISGCLMLTAIRSGSHARTRSAATLCLLLNTFDVTSTLLEWRARSRHDETITGGILLSGSGIIAFAAALRRLQTDA
jgi:hypothetical protein